MADACYTVFHPCLLLSLCSHTVDFYGMGLVPIGCKTGTPGLSDVCVWVKSVMTSSALCFPLTVDSILSAICLPPGLLAAVRQNWIHTSISTSEHVHTVIGTHIILPPVLLLNLDGAALVLRHGYRGLWWATTIVHTHLHKHIQMYSL